MTVRVLSLCCLLTALFAVDQRPQLRILNWSTYIDIDQTVADDRPMVERSPTLAAFAAAEDCDIEYIEFDTENEALQKVLNLPGMFDIVVAAGYMADSLAANGRLRPIPVTGLTNLVHMDARYAQQPSEAGTVDRIPYLAGTTGLVYRRDLIGQPITSWRQIFEPPPEVAGRICVLDEPTLLFSMALAVQGIDPSQDHDPAVGAFRQASGMVATLMRSGAVPHVESDPEHIYTLLSSGSAAVAMVYSGDAYWMQQEFGAERLAYVIPEEGGEFYIDYLSVLRDAPHPELAQRFIDYIIQPQVQGRLAHELGYICPNATGQAWLRSTYPDHFANPIVDPNPGVLARTRLLDSLSWEERVQKIWQALREEGK